MSLKRGLVDYDNDDSNEEKEEAQVLVNARGAIASADQEILYGASAPSSASVNANVQPQKRIRIEDVFDRDSSSSSSESESEAEMPEEDEVVKIKPNPTTVSTDAQTSEATTIIATTTTTATTGTTTATTTTPSAAVAIAEPVKKPPVLDLPADSVWAAVLDESTGEHYYWNRHTNVTTWEKLVVLEDLKSPMNAPMNAHAYYQLQPQYAYAYQYQAQAQQIGHVHGQLHDSSRRRKPTKAQIAQARAKSELDPLDPSSYSDAKPGGWSTGLNTARGGGRGIGGTALPTPGDVLKSKGAKSSKNAEKPEKRKKQPKYDPVAMNRKRSDLI